FIQRYRDTLSLHSFPTRRSSDLLDRADVVNVGLVDNAGNDFPDAVLNDTRNFGPDFQVDEIIRRDARGNEKDRTQIGISYFRARSEEHTSELQSRSDLVCRLLLE